MASTPRSSSRIRAAARQASPRSTASIEKRKSRKDPQTSTVQKGTQSVKRKAPLVIGQAKKPRTQSNKEAEDSIHFHVRPGRRHPPWASLPYGVLLSIFQFAAYPLVNEHWNRSETIHWLLRSSLVCKAFLEPALAALYHGPPIVHATQYQAFSRLITSDQTKSIDYRSKVHQLDFEVNHTKFATFAADLGELVSHLPALRAFGLHQAADTPQPLNVSVPQTTRAELIYREEWLKSLASVNLTALKFHSLGLHRQKGAMFESWALDSDALRPSFRHLRRLEIAGFSDTPNPHRRLAQALQALPSLRHLIFLRTNFNLNCNLGSDDIVLNHLPPHLLHLEIISCYQVTADQLLTTLRLSGSNLRSLVLRHNRDTNLGFLPRLSELCPRLEVLDYDLSLFSTLITLSHAEPAFSEMLSAGQVPSWPSTLQSLEMNQLRKWDGQTAEDFFNSLRESAPSLPDLRRIWITASVSAGWRERATFRTKIVEPLIEVFSRDHAESQAPTTTALSSSTRNGTNARNRTPPIHGKCDTVHIRVDNQRPAEELKTEADFLDSEQSGDEDYAD